MTFHYAHSRLWRGATSDQVADCSNTAQSRHLVEKLDLPHRAGTGGWPSDDSSTGPAQPSGKAWFVGYD